MILIFYPIHEWTHKYIIVNVLLLTNIVLRNGMEGKGIEEERS